MRTLIRKDWRLIRPILIAGGILYAAPLVIACVYSRFFSLEPPKTVVQWLELIVGVLMLSFLASMLTAPALSGVMFARERRERTAEFVATLPVSRASIVHSKAIVAVVAFLIPGAVTLAAMGVIAAFLRATTDIAPGHPAMPDVSGLVLALGVLSSGAFMAFGIAWLFSTILRSEVLASAYAFLVVISLITVVVMYQMRMVDENPRYTLSPLACSLAMAGAGVIAFAIGYVIALRRASP